MSGGNVKPVNGYVSRRLWKVATAFLDEQGVLTKIVKTRRVKKYFLYVNGEIKGKSRKTRQAVMKQVYILYNEILNK